MKTLFFVISFMVISMLGVSQNPTTLHGSYKVTGDITVGDDEISPIDNEFRIRVLEGADVIAPGADSAFIQIGNDSLIRILMTELLGLADNDSIQYGLSYTYGTETGTIDSAIVSGLYLFVYVGENIPLDSIVYISYLKPVSKGIHDPSYNYTASFSNKLVFNGTSATEYQAFVYHLLNGNLDDKYGVFDGTPVGSQNYLADTAFYFPDSDGNDGFEIDSLPNQHTLWWEFKLVEDAAESYYLAANKDTDTEDGFSLKAAANGSGDFGLTYVVGNGVASTFAYTSVSYSIGIWYQVVCTVNRYGDGSDAWVSFYVNGVKNTTDTVCVGFSDDFAVGGQDIIIGARDPATPSDGLREDAVLGKFGIDSTIWTQVKVDSLWARTDDDLWNVGAVPTPEEYYTDSIVHEWITFDGHALGDLSEAEVDALFTGTTISANSTYNGEIVMLDTARCWKIPAPKSNYPSIGRRIVVTTPGEFTEVWYSENDYLAVSWPDGLVGKASGLIVSDSGATTSQTGEAVSANCTDPAWESSKYLITDGSTPRGGFFGLDFGTYMYDHNKRRLLTGCNVEYGTYYLPEEPWTRQTWYNRTIRVVLNTVDTEGTGNADGVLEIYIEGVCVLSRGDIIYREYSDLYIDQYWLGMFFGGGAYPDREATDMYIDDPCLWNLADGHGYAKGNNANPVGTVIVPPNINNK